MKRKLFPTKLAEFRRLIWDRRLDKMLKSPEGRAEYWRDLGSRCDRSPMITMLKSALQVSGDVIECGVYRGSSLMRIARTIRETQPSKRLFALDSFQGFPEGSVLDIDVGKGRWKHRVKQKFRFCADTPTRLKRCFDAYGVSGEIVAGYFSQTLSRFRQHSFCFVHLDVDLYTSYIECLDALYDRVTPGGVIVFDECDSGAWPGSERAIREFFSHRPETIETLVQGEVTTYYVRKQPAVAVRQSA